MKKDIKKTKVVFRKFEGEVTAIFPDETWNLNGDLVSYAHIGQHGPATREYRSISEPCTKEEYQDLLKELKNLGYNLKVINLK